MGHESDLFVLLAILALIALVVFPWPWRGSGYSGGTARTAKEPDLARAGMIGGRDGLVLGRMRAGPLLNMVAYVHLAIFAPTAAGKGVSFVIPWLRSYRRGSVVVIDPKGENYRLSADWRRSMGQMVVRIDPFEVCGANPSCFNPFDLIGNGPECVDGARALAEAMVIRPTAGGERDPYWSDMAAAFLTFVISWILTDLRHEERNLVSLRQMVSQADICLAAVDIMKKKGGVFANMAGIVEQLQSTEEGGVWSRAGSSVVSSAQQHTNFLDSEAIIRSVSKSTFDVRDVFKGKLAIYVILPSVQLEAQSRFLRLIITSLIRLIMREGPQEN